MADKKPGRGGHGAPKKKGKKAPKLQEVTTGVRKSNKREKSATRRRLHDGQPVIPVMYRGSTAGKGNYVAGMVDGVMVADDTGKPIPFRNLPLEEKTLSSF